MRLLDMAIMVVLAFLFMLAVQFWRDCHGDAIYNRATAGQRVCRCMLLVEQRGSPRTILGAIRHGLRKIPNNGRS